MATTSSKASAAQSSRSLLFPFGRPYPTRPAVPTQPSTPSVPDNCAECVRCPAGYQVGVTENGQTFEDLMLLHNVSFDELHAANPALPTTRIPPGTRYCIPPTATGHICPDGAYTYTLGPQENLNVVSLRLGISPGLLLTANPQLAPGDFTPGREICVP